MSDHQKIKSLANEIQNATMKGEGGSVNQQFNQLNAIVAPHMKAEEQVFYPEIEKNNKTMALMAIEEHNLTKLEAADLSKMPKNSDLWKAKFNVMKDLTEHHIMEEETSVFAEARKTLSEDKLKELGDRFRQVEGTMPNNATSE